MDWFTLGIAPTKDKKTITDAYRQKLRQTNPEDKPEEFKALRTAYEQAIAYANQADTQPVRDESPVGYWMEAIEALYADYASRIDPMRWKALMGNAVCIGLDSRPAAEEALLKFLMEHYYLPKAVWLVLDETFHFSQRTEELYGTWPREFIDHAVISGIRLDPSLNYEMFIPGINGTDCDAYRRLYFQANQTPLEKLGPILDQMEALTETHPYGQGLRCRYLLEIGRPQEAKEGLRDLAHRYPDDAPLAIVWAEICLEDGNVDEAQQISQHIIDLEPKHLGAKRVYAQCLAAMQQYHEAKECAYEIIRASGENPILAEEVAQLIKQWNQALIVKREATYAQHPEDTENIIELAWCYAQNDRTDDAFALAAKVDPAYEDGFLYHNLMGKLYHNTGKFAEAMPYFQTVENILRNMEDDGTEKTRKRLERLPEMLQIQGNCLMQLGKTEEAKEKFEQTLAVAPDDEAVLSLMGKILFNSGDYVYAVQILQRLAQVSPGAWVAELLTAMSLYRLRRDREAFEAVDRALAIQGGDLSLYMLKMQILIRNGVFGEVHETLQFLKENGAPQDIASDFILAELTHFEKKDERAALKQYKSLQKRLEFGEDLMFTPELYYHLAVLTGNQLDLRQVRNRKTVLELVDKGLSIFAQDTDLLSYKAWVLKMGGKQDDAIAMYRELEEKDPQSIVALRGIADIYYEDLNHYAADALAYFEKLLDVQKTAELYFFAATCKRHLGDLEGARLYYLKELEMDAEDIDGYRGLAFICDARGNYEESLELLDQALNIMAEYGRSFDWMVEHKAKVLRRLGRYEEALHFAEEAAERFGYGATMQLQFDICCQAGWWERAEKVLQAWKRVNRNDPNLIAAKGRLNLLQGKMFKAAFAMGPAKHKLPSRDVEDFRLQLADLECNHERQIQIYSRRIYQDSRDDHALTSLALAYWYAGKIDAAKAAAHKALAVLDELLTETLTDAPLCRTRRSVVLAILGRSEEAVEELEQTKKLPLCDACEYGSCKDAEIVEAHIHEILGNCEEAKKRYTEGKCKWPDDLDFAAGEARLTKKGKK